MKKIIFSLAALIAIGTAAAQNPEAIQKKIDKNNVTIADPKKGNAPGTWLERANIYYELANFYTKNLLQGLTEAQASSMIGKPSSNESIIAGGTEMMKLEYPDFTVFATPKDGAFQFWLQKKGNELDALNTSTESLAKMKEIDQKSFTSKGVPLCNKLAEQYTFSGRAFYSTSNSAKAAEYFDGAAKAKELTGVIDTLSIYYAGLAYGEAENWEKSASTLDKVLSYGFDEGGNVQIYLAAAYEQLKQPDKALKVLETAFEKAPNNPNVLASLINAYIANNIDPEKIITMIKRAEAINPKDATLYMVEGTIWHKLGNAEKAEEAFSKSIEYDNKNFKTFYNLGLIRAQHGDAIIKKAEAIDLNDTKGYDKLIAEATAVYTKSIEAFEKAHELDKTDMSTIEMLRALYFQRQDKGEEFVKRYDYFNKLMNDGKE